MRIRASTESISFDEFAPHIGGTIHVALNLRAAYIGSAGEGLAHSGLPLDFSGLGERELVQLPQLGRTMTAVRGFLRRSDPDTPVWTIESLVDLEIKAKDSGLTLALDDLVRDAEVAPCEAFGALTVVGKEMSAHGRSYVPAKLVRLQSLCLRSQDARFGQWLEARRYGDLGSDPDVIGAPVCIAELQLPP